LYEILKASGTKCKIWFNQRAKNIGTTITAPTCRYKKTTKPDLFHLHQLAVSVDRYIQAEEWIAAKGFVGGVIRSLKAGHKYIRLHDSSRKCIKEINELSKHFGSSRSSKLQDKKKTIQTKQIYSVILKTKSWLQKLNSMKKYFLIKLLLPVLCFSILQFSAGIDAQSEAAVGCTTIINQL
jgi:aspartyl aminopeptidase